MSGIWFQVLAQMVANGHFDPLAEWAVVSRLLRWVKEKWMPERQAKLRLEHWADLWKILWDAQHERERMIVLGRDWLVENHLLGHKHWCDIWRRLWQVHHEPVRLRQLVEDHVARGLELPPDILREVYGSS